MMRINAGGTIIPSVSLGVAAAAVCKQARIFVAGRLATNVVASVGNWS